MRLSSVSHKAGHARRLQIMLTLLNAVKSLQAICVVSVTEFARRIGISRKCASDYVNKHAGTSVEMAHRLAKAPTTPLSRGC